MEKFQVSLKKVVDDSYEICIGEQLVDQMVDDLASGLVGTVNKYAVITDSTVGPLYAEPVLKGLRARGFTGDLFVIPAGEEHKTREEKARIEDEMLGKGYRRDCCVVAVGGGVVTDLAGFLAGTFARGVPFVNYATTLLAAADASIGGKTAVDTPLATNLIGLFYQPKKVYIDLAAWKTLPKRQIVSGMAETIKHACLADRLFFSWLEENMDKILTLDPECCLEIAKNNCRIKYEVVMQDERESGLREVLNLGHTVGRAVETVSNYQLMHGEAVGIGLAAACALAVNAGIMPTEDAKRVCILLEKAGLPVRIPSYVDADVLLKKLYTDKKVRNGRLRFVLPEQIGKIYQVADNDFGYPVTEEQAKEAILAIS